MPPQHNAHVEYGEDSEGVLYLVACDGAACAGRSVPGKGFRDWLLAKVSADMHGSRGAEFMPRGMPRLKPPPEELAEEEGQVLIERLIAERGEGEVERLFKRFHPALSMALTEQQLSAIGRAAVAFGSLEVALDSLTAELVSPGDSDAARHALEGEGISVQLRRVRLLTQYHSLAAPLRREIESWASFVENAADARNRLLHGGYQVGPLAEAGIIKFRRSKPSILTDEAIIRMSERFWTLRQIGLALTMEVRRIPRDRTRAGV